MIRGRIVLLFLILSLALVMVSCNSIDEDVDVPIDTEEPAAEATATPVPPTDTPVVDEAPDETPTSEAPSEEEELTYVSVEIPEAGLQFEVPESWVRLEPDWVWAPSPDADRWVGVKWATLNPPEEPEAVLLPGSSQILEAEPVETPIGTGRRITLGVYAPAAEDGGEDRVVESVEVHVLIIESGPETRVGYDFYAAAEDEELIPLVEPVLAQMVASASLTGEVVDGADVDEQLRRAVAEALNADPDEVTVLRIEPREWPDACLGLSVEGEVCAQVITPGYYAEVRVGDEVYAVRTNQDVTQVAFEEGPPGLDERGDGGDQPAPPIEDAPEAVVRARTILADHLDVAEDAVALVSFEYVEWNDACLGLQSPGQACAQVITPGYRVTFEVDGTEYEVHTDETGDSVAIVP